jgi:hypothetical protein
MATVNSNLDPCAVLSTVIAQLTFPDIELKLETIRLIDCLRTDLSDVEFSDETDEAADNVRKLAYQMELESNDDDEDEADTPYTIDDDSDDEDDVEFDIEKDDDDDE